MDKCNIHFLVDRMNDKKIKELILKNNFKIECNHILRFSCVLHLYFNTLHNHVSNHPYVRSYRIRIVLYTLLTIADVDSSEGVFFGRGV